jgi:hypothetical protein
MWRKPPLPQPKLLLDLGEFLQVNAFDPLL